MTLTFGYWDCRGRGAAIRNLLRYVGADYKEELYTLEGPDILKSWFEGKRNTLGLDFPNMPYLIDGEVKLTQSMAIIRYLGRKFGLAATVDPALGIEDQLLFQLNDMIERMIISNYHKQPQYITEADFEKEMEELRKDLQEKLDRLETFIGAKKWLTGDSISYVDFIAYEILGWYRDLVQKDCLEKRGKLTAFMKRFEDLAPLKEYLASDVYRKNAIFGPFAKFGNKKKE